VSRVVPGALAPALLAAVAALAPAHAWADRGELLWGGAAVGELPGAAGVDGLAQLGLTDVLWLRGSVGGRYRFPGVAGEALVGLVGAWDVLAWVPELSVSAGGTVGARSDLELQVGAGLRRWVGLDTSFTIVLSGGYRPRLGERYGTLSIGLRRRTSP
jgi:hypothetical protein